MEYADLEIESTVYGENVITHTMKQLDEITKRIKLMQTELLIKDICKQVVHGN